MQNGYLNYLPSGLNGGKGSHYYREFPIFVITG